MTRRAGAVPERVAVTVERLDVAPDAAVLEIGCGAGVAAELVAARLRTGTILATDRSATAVANARRRLAPYVAGGRARVEQIAVEDADLPPGTYDAIFAINVNVFWTGTDPALVGRLLRALRPAGRLVLAYEPPSPDRVPVIEARLRGALEGVGATVSVAGHPLGRSRLLVTEATPPHQRTGTNPDS
ncbi:hypothetical protein GCM10009809_17630 [Isoptericola hypogeus]|uniref:Methyltransferase domain-containing protein n=1 Tax=Isoptericola hypogeus TaxID=300179 RepID=A0ABN2JCC3_9MICO